MNNYKHWHKHGGSIVSGGGGGGGYGRSLRMIPWLGCWQEKKKEKKSPNFQVGVLLVS